MPNVKPGDLCIVLGNVHTKELAGRVVIVKSIYNGERIFEVNGKLYHARHDPKTWICTSTSNLPWKLNDGKTVYVPERPIADWALYKLNDQDLDEEVENTNNLDIEEKV